MVPLRRHRQGRDFQHHTVQRGSLVPEAPTPSASLEPPSPLIGWGLLSDPWGPHWRFVFVCWGIMCRSKGYNCDLGVRICIYSCAVCLILISLSRCSANVGGLSMGMLGFFSGPLDARVYIGWCSFIVVFIPAQ